MVKCYFCYRNETTSYWDYYCESCTKVKQFCKLIGSEKLCKSLQFKINDEKLGTLSNSVLEEEAKSDPQKPRKSPRLNQNNQ